MSSPVAGRADFQAYASWMGTPIVIPSAAYPVGTTIIEDLSLANYSALDVLAFDVAGNGVLQFQFFTDATKAQSVDVYQYILTGGNALNLTIPMISPFVEISVIVNVGQTFRLISIFTPNNTPVLRPTYPGQVRNVSANGLSVAANSSNFQVAQYLIAGQTYAFFQPADSTGKLDFAVRALDSNGNVAYELMKFQAPTGPTGFTFLSPCQPIRIEVVNNDAANPHVCNYTVQQIGN